MNIYAAKTRNPDRIKFSTDKDCMPPDAIVTAVYTSTADINSPRDVSERFWHCYDQSKWLETLGIEVCIDFGARFYETGMQAPTHVTSSA